jgi:hypothetical protein
MKFLDRLIGLTPEQANPDNRKYEKFRTAVKWAAVGITAIAVGLTVDIFNSEIGSNIVLGGAAVEMIGGAALAMTLGELTLGD